MGGRLGEASAEQWMMQQSAQWPPCFIGSGARSPAGAGAVEQIVASASGSSVIAKAQPERMGDRTICSAKAASPIHSPHLFASRERTLSRLLVKTGGIIALLAMGAIDLYQAWWKGHRRGGSG